MSSLSQPFEHGLIAFDLFAIRNFNPVKFLGTLLIHPQKEVKISKRE